MLLAPPCMSVLPQSAAAPGGDESCLPLSSLPELSAFLRQHAAQLQKHVSQGSSPTRTAVTHLKVGRP